MANDDQLAVVFPQKRLNTLLHAPRKTRVALAAGYDEGAVRVGQPALIIRVVLQLVIGAALESAESHFSKRRKNGVGHVAEQQLKRLLRAQHAGGGELSALRDGKLSAFVLA